MDAVPKLVGETQEWVDREGAIKAFRRSYQENFTSFDAKWALDYLGVSP